MVQDTDNVHRHQVEFLDLRIRQRSVPQVLLVLVTGLVFPATIIRKRLPVLAGLALTARDDALEDAEHAILHHDLEPLKIIQHVHTANNGQPLVAL